MKTLEFRWKNQVFSVNILRVEFVDPFSHVTCLLEQEFLSLLFACLRFCLRDYALFEDFHDENRHVSHLSMHNVQAFHLHVCVILVCLAFFK